jgi:hypothetical protein
VERIYCPETKLVKRQRLGRRGKKVRIRLIEEVIYAKSHYRTAYRIRSYGPPGVTHKSRRHKREGS